MKPWLRKIFYALVTGQQIVTSFSLLLLVILSLISTYMLRESIAETRAAMVRYSNDAVSSTLKILDTWIRLHSEIITSLPLIPLSAKNIPDVRSKLQVIKASGDLVMAFIGTEDGLMIRNAEAVSNIKGYDPRVRPV